ncbi:MAG: cytochrome c biogenesis protein CcsA [Phycisphaerales bacterium]|nr:cytochrome c biogenesis protein CcsA [Phycisphaerales bacterium]
MRLWIVLMVLVFGSVRSAAQTAPEGNAHPAPEHGEAAPVQAFGPPAPPAPGNPASAVEAKAGFARAVDVGPLRALAVNEGGRVKIIEALAREAIGEITGRRRYEEWIAGDTPEAKPRKVTFDPVFSLFDMVIDPGYYVQRPVVMVDYEPLRRAMVEEGIPELVTGPDGRMSTVVRPLDAKGVERYLRLTRVSPLMLAHMLNAMRDKYESSEPYRVALGKVGRSLERLDTLEGSLRLVAPASTEDRWHFLGEDRPELAKANDLARRLGEAWRAQDAAKVNEIIRALASELPTLNAGMYPGWRRSIESLYTRGKPFTWGLWGYFLALVALLLAFGTERRWLVGVGVGLLGAAVAMHAAGFIARCIIAERFAIQNQFESMTGVSLFASIVACAIMAWRRQWLFGAAAAGTGFLVLITATEARIPGQNIGREAAILNTSVLLKYHVTTVLCSYGLIALGFVTSVFYLGVSWAGRLRGSQADRRALKDLDTATMIVLQLAFWTLGVGILLGAWWADHSWGRWWAWDPKETWALLTWIIYLILIHVRLVSKKRESLTAWLSVAGFVTMLWTYFGVNLLLPGLHAYA